LNLLITKAKETPKTICLKNNRTVNSDKGRNRHWVASRICERLG